MTEFLKNNPIALSHCRLYERLQKKSVEIAFTDFCRVVRKEAIKKEEFQKWFDQFKQGIFDESIDDMRNTLRNDKYALRACVFCESLKYKQLEKNISESYRFWKNDLIDSRSYSVYKDFCEVIGDDVMEYRDFDFWFYRFLNGGYDISFERNREQKVYELSDMPIDIIGNVVEYLDMFDR
uniref:Mos1 transposase HTH domain-containing protein n=1 Tax=Caenorhabditis brenneri TaxID=135651 RepID=B6VBP7_CAEBE|nr:hypothetical protein Cbre_JD18.001 [Caenorhabditis brenneri]